MCCVGDAEAAGVGPEEPDCDGDGDGRGAGVAFGVAGGLTGTPEGPGVTA